MRHDSLRIDLGSNCCGRVNFSPSLSPREYESADVREGRCVENATRASDGQMAVIARETIASAGWVSMFNFIDRPVKKSVRSLRSRLLRTDSVMFFETRLAMAGLCVLVVGEDTHATHDCDFFAAAAAKCQKI